MSEFVTINERSRAITVGPDIENFAAFFPKKVKMESVVLMIYSIIYQISEKKLKQDFQIQKPEQNSKWF